VCRGKLQGAAEQMDQTKAADLIRKELAEAREELVLHRAPIRTLLLFVRCVAGFLASRALLLLQCFLVIVPTVVIWLALKSNYPEKLFAEPVCGSTAGGVLWQVEFAIGEALWWLVLGILSSVGFGTGLHSGMMFLFPHVMQVVGAAEACKTTEGLNPWYRHPCRLDCSTTFGPKDGSTVTMLRLFLMVTVPCMLWGFGTALGELPPYMVSKTARLSGGKDAEYEAELEDAKEAQSPFQKMKLWTISFTERHGFLGVFLLASWPNAAFDMCGMCCGYLLMPFWTFFVATACGKGIVKVNLQALLFVNLFGSGFFKVLLTAIEALNGSLAGITGKDFGLATLVANGRSKLLQQFELQSRIMPEKLFAGNSGDLDVNAIKKLYGARENSAVIAQRVLQQWDQNGDGKLTLPEVQMAASRTDSMVSLASLDPGAGTSILKFCWELFVVGLVLFFVVSIVNQLARVKQQELDDAQVEEILHKGGKGNKAKNEKKKDK